MQRVNIVNKIITNYLAQGKLPAVPRKWFGSAVCDTLYTIYPSLCTQSADPNHFRGTAGSIVDL